MAFSTTTKEVIQNNARLKVFETLEIKRRFVGGYEADWFDISSYLLFTNATSVQQKLDFESFGFGQFKTGTAKFTLDNTQGAFNNVDDLRSLFLSAISRHYTKVRYHAGYKDEDGTNIDEIVFEGLINAKTINQVFETGSIKFGVLAYEQILSERTIAVGSISSTLASDVIEEILTDDTTITDFINVNGSNINPDNDLTFDDASKFEGKKVASVLNDIAKKTNSAWHVDSSQNIIFRNRDANAVTAFAFIGGNRQRRDVNIVQVKSFSDGYTRLINQVKYTSGSTETITSDSDANLAKFGTNTLELEGEDITTGATITTLSNAIITDESDPKIHIVLTTVYMPNVISFFDPCTIDYRPKTTTRGLRPLIWNDGQSRWNAGYFWGIFVNRNIIKPNITFLYYGFKHNVKNGITEHFLKES